MGVSTDGSQRGYSAPRCASGAHVAPISSAAFVTRRLTGLVLDSTSDRVDDASFFTGELSERLL